MDMNAHERDEFEELINTVRRLESQLSSLFNVISGNDPVIGKTLSFAERLSKVERTITWIKVLLIGIGIGVLIGGLIFGVLTLKTVVDAIKTVKP
jgi:hypothetical protein